MSTGMLVLLVTPTMRTHMPEAQLGFELMKLPIKMMDRAIMVDILKTAEDNPDIIVNLDEDECSRMNMAAATKKWEELCDSMGCSADNKEFIYAVGGKTGKVTGKFTAVLKVFAEKVTLEEVSGGSPILFDVDWQKKFDKASSKKRPVSDLYKSDQSLLAANADNPSKKFEVAPEEESGERNTVESVLEEMERCHQEEMEELKSAEEERRKELEQKYEAKLENLRIHQQEVADEIDDRDKKHKIEIDELEKQITDQKHERVIEKQELEELKAILEIDVQEKHDLKQQMTELRSLVQSLQTQRTIKHELNVTKTNNDWSMSSSEDEHCPVPQSTPGTRKMKITTLSNSKVPNSLNKLGLSAFNRAKTTKMEYLSKFVLLTEDYADDEFKQIKSLLFQGLSDDSEFRIHDLTSDDKSTLEKLVKAIIRQEYGDSCDLMKHFDEAQIKHGESHLNYYFRISGLYQMAANTTEGWKDVHSHAQNIYFKIENSLPSAARSKFKELMIEHRKDSSMKMANIRSTLDTVLMIFKDELKNSMASQRHMVPMVDAIKSNSKEFEKPKRELVCWKCNSRGHMKKDCPQASNRESKTKPGSSTNSRRCYSCQGVGHFAAQCPNRKREHSKWTESKSQ